MPIIREAPAALAPSATCKIYGNKEIDAMRQINYFAEKITGYNYERDGVIFLGS